MCEILLKLFLRGSLWGGCHFALHGDSSGLRRANLWPPGVAWSGGLCKWRRLNPTKPSPTCNRQALVDRQTNRDRDKETVRERERERQTYTQTDRLLLFLSVCLCIEKSYETNPNLGMSYSQRMIRINLWTYQKITKVIDKTSWNYKNILKNQEFYRTSM